MNRKVTATSSNTWKPNRVCQITQKRSFKRKKIDMNENTIYKNLWDIVAKGRLRGAAKAPNTYIRNKENSHINNLRSYLRNPEEEQQIKGKASRKVEIINRRAKMNEMENKVPTS